MQQPELGGSRYLRPGPPSSLANSTDEQFTPNEQTAEVAPACSAEQDIVQTHYSPRGVVLLYFQGDSSVEVDKHFNRTFSELYCLPSGAEKCVDGSHLQGRPTVPMSQRNLPASFWIPPSTDQIHQLPTSYHRQGNSMRLFQQNAPSRTTYYSTGCHATNGSQVSLERTAPNVVHTYAIPVSYTQLPMGAVKRFPPGHPQQGSQPSYKASAPPLTQETDIHCNEVQTSFRFNPGYNTLLVQPEVKPHLPVVPGEPSRANSHDEKRNHISPIYPGELMTTPKREEN